MGPADAILLTADLAVSRSLSSINLNNHDIGSEGAKVLAPAIRDSHSLTAADLRFNQLHDDAEQLVRESVKDRVGFDLKL